MARLSRSRRARAARSNRRRSARVALGPEVLESRALLSAAPYHDVWVNGAWLDAGTLGPASLTPGEQVTDGVVTKTYGADAFSAIQAGVAAVASGGEVHVDPGVYGENIDVAKNLSIEAVGAATLQSPSAAAALTVESGCSVFVAGLAIVDSPIGVRIDGGSATISGATISNNMFGIYVNGGAAAISGSQVFANTTGIRFFNSATGSVTGNNFAGGMSPANGMDLLLSASAGTVTIGAGNVFAGTAYIDNETNHSIDATAANSFGGANLADLDSGTASGLAGLYAVEDRVTDGLDQSGAGLVRLKSGDVFLAQSSETTRNGSLQRAVNLAGPGNAIYIQAGMYVADANFIDAAAGLVAELNIDKPLSLIGPNADFDPQAGTTPIHPQAIILPGTSNPNPADSTAVSVIGVRASQVTIRGLTIDGDNPALAADPRTIVYNGVPINAFDGISCFAGVGSLTIDHNIVRNTTYTGIDLENGSTAANAANSVAYNLIKNIGGAGAGFGTGVFLSNNFYAAVTNNVVDTALVGIQTQGFSAANPAGPGTAQISGNTIAAVGSGIWFNDFSAAASPFAVSDNTITAVEDSAGLGRWVGVLISSQLAGAGATFQNNAIDGSATAANPSQTSSGYQVWNAPASGAPFISGGSVVGVQIGVWVNSFEGNSDNAGATHAAVNGVNIIASQIGVYIEDSPQNAAHPAVSATIDGGTIRATSSSAGVGVKISGASASATINGVTIDDPLYGIEASAGSSVVADSLIENNGTGIFAHGGSSVTISSNSILGNTTGIEIADATLVSATNNNVSGGQLGIHIDANAIEVGPIGGGNLVGNSIAGNTVAGLRNDSSLAIDATGNWWGSADGPNSPLNTYHANNPSADAVVGVPLTIAPWLTDGTNTAPATNGFQPTALDAHAPSLNGQADQSAIEGAAQAINFGSFSDPDNAGGGPWHVIVDWGDNSASDSFNALSAGNLGALLHTFGHEAHYTVTVSIIEQAGTSDSAAFDVNVADAAPVVTATNGSVSAAENASAHNTGTYGDYDDAVSVSGIGVTDNHDGTWSWSGTGDEEHPYDVTVTATNAHGSQSSTTFHVSFSDVAPTIAADHDAVSAVETAAAHNSGTYGDYDDAVSVSGAGVTDNHDGTWSWSGAGDEDHPYDVTVTATNAHGSQSSTTFHVSFSDVAPTVTVDHDTVSAAENASAHNTGTYGDYDDVVSVAGNGVTDNHDGTWSWSGTGDEDHPYDVTVTATNADGLQTSTTFHVSFNDVAPTVAADHDALSTTENSTAHNAGAYGDYDDAVSVSGAGVTDNHDGTWSWSGTGDEEHPYDVTVTATNAHGSQTSTTFHVLFTDIAPTITAVHDSVNAAENSAAHNSGTYGDYDDAVSVSGNGVTDNHDGTWSWSGTGDEDHPYDVTVTTTNADGSQASTTFHVSFNDVAPTVTVDHDTVSAAENASAHNTGTYGDYDDVVSVAGTGVTDNHDGTWSWSGTGDEEHPYDATVTATNAHGSQTSTTFHVSFTDIAPTIADEHDAVSVVENATAQNSGTYGDYDDFVSVSGIGVTDNHDGTWSWSGTGDEEHPYDVIVTATNAHGLQTSTTFHASFTDAPLNGSSTAAAGGTEGAAGSSVLSAATFTDANPGDHAGDFTATVHWGDDNSSPGVVSYSGGVYTVSAAHTYAQEGTFNITIEVADVGGSSTTIAGTATVADPPIDAMGGFLVAAGIQSDSGMTTVATFTDPGGAEDPNADYSATIDWGDSSPATPGTIAYDGLNAMFIVEGSHTYSSPNPGTYPIQVTIHHEAATAQIVSSTAHVASLSIDLSADPAPVNEAAPLTLTLGAVNDPHPLEQSQITGYDIDWGDGSPPESYSFSGTWSPGTIAKTHIYADGPENWTIHVSLHDASGLHPNVGSLPISVLNVAPTVNVAGDLSVNQNSLFTKTGSFADPGADGWVGQVNFGDGSGWQPLTLAADKTFTLSHSYSSAFGSPYLVSVQVADHDGAAPDALSGMGAFQVTVNPPPTFQVDSFTGSSSGFDVTFDRPIDASRLNLYQGASDELGPVDVTLIGQHSNSPVRGSLVWDAATNTAHLVATGGLLPPDTYSVDLASRVDGWTDSNGSPLDGLATGIAGSGDYRNTFVVAAPAVPVLSLPDFARGPAQSLDVNADGTARTSGLPVHLSNAAGLRSLSFEIDFDPSLLNLTGAIKASGLPDDWSVTALRTNSGGGGQLVVSASGTTALAAGPRDVVDLLGDIPSGASYRAAQLLKPINVQLNSGAIGVVVDEAVEKIAYFGDATGDSTLSGLDASFISRNIVSLDDGFSAYPLTDPRIIADVTGNGTLSGLDASFVANASVGNPQPTIPAVPSHATPAMSGLDPTVAIPLGVSAEPGGTVTLPVTVSEVNGMQAIDLTFSYDPAAFSVSPTDLSLSGAVAAEGWAEALSLSTPGLIRLSLYGTHPIAASGADTLLGITFHVSATAADGEYPISVVTTPSTASRLNEGLFALSASNGSVVVAAGFEVVNTNDDGPGSFRQAIVSANALGGPTHTIRFTLPTGRQTIQPLTPLPATSASVVIQLDASQDVTILGNIDGTGSLVVNAGSNLTADRIVQSTLVIGGTEGNFGTVAIAASDAAGNPLVVAAPAVNVESSMQIDTIATNPPPIEKSLARHPAAIRDGIAGVAPSGSVVANGFEPDSASISAVAPRAETLADKTALDAAFARTDFNPVIDDVLLNLLAGSARRRHRGTNAVTPTDEATADEPSEMSAFLD